MNKRRRQGAMKWRRADLHLHTPVSADYEEPERSYLEILQKAEGRGLDIIAITDHNTLSGYRAMQQEIEQLTFLEGLQRLRPEEKRQLDEYRRLLKKILVLPGFEFTATFGFHILGIFSNTVPLREIDYILLALNIPSDKLDEGSVEVGATTDVLTAYRLIDEAGGIVIAAHANSSHGVAMRGLRFGGQTRIAYTQDPHLHALEVTDLEKKGRRTTAQFFSGSKPEYPRRMRCIQGSDAHRLMRDPKNPKRIGVGERATEFLLPEISFEALRELFLGDDFARSRPYRPTHAPFDHIRAAWEQGPNIVQSFHEGYTRRGGRMYAIVADVCAFANTNGGTTYVGLPASKKKKPIGVDNPNTAIKAIRQEIEGKITPPIQVAIDVQKTGGVQVVRLVVPRGDDPPYAIDDNRIYVRGEAETSLAVRDEIVQIVRRGLGLVQALPEAGDEAEVPSGKVEPPRTGVEIIASEERRGTFYHTMRDLRNGNVVKNVTRKSARRLWHYAITQHEAKKATPDQVQWHGEIGLWQRRKYRGEVMYDLVQRDNGGLRVYYGVTEAGVHSEWNRLIGGEEE
ncbi:MAG: putative DNA binding domain-containing protein [Anaerolineae bacterium]